MNLAQLDLVAERNVLADFVQPRFRLLEELAVSGAGNVRQFLGEERAMIGAEYAKSGQRQGDRRQVLRSRRADPA